MADNILDDVKQLLDKEVGDKRILIQIKRAAENNEAISNYERNYVTKLVKEHLAPAPPPPEPIPEVSLEELTPPKEQIPTIRQKFVAPTIVERKPRDKTNTKVFIGGGIIALAIIVAVVVGTNGVDFGSGIDIGTGSSPSISNLPLDTDQSSYDKGDIISISGKSKASLGNTISLTIENTSNDIVWNEDIKIKDNGQFSTLTFAGGPGWELSGTYTLKMKHGSEDNQITFNFKN